MQQWCLYTTRHACKAMLLPYPNAGWHLGFQACGHPALPDPPLALQTEHGPGYTVGPASSAVAEGRRVSLAACSPALATWTLLHHHHIALLQAGPWLDGRHHGV